MSDGPFTLFFDGDCPFCVREAAMLRRRDGRDGLRFVDIADPGFDPAAAVPGRPLTREEFSARIHGLHPDGRLETGVGVFREAYRRVGLGWLLAPTAWPILRPLADAGYRWFARNRVRLGGLFGRSCGPEGSCRRPETPTERLSP
jgi:predicted DCC family thiol-disulfide oxidoreductase YuxK